ncbi:MAG: hypothetical protein ACLF0G_08430 [Candidatus Brocadiia bacterium]
MVNHHALEVTNWLRECPECGYQNGFHVSFHRSASETDGHTVSVRLICPSCSGVFETGLKLLLERDR